MLFNFCVEVRNIVITTFSCGGGEVKDTTNK